MVVGKNGKGRGRAARFQSSRDDERPRHAGAMESRSRAQSGVTAHPPRQRLYLITPLVDDAASFAPELERALGSGDVAAVLLRLAQGGERSLIERVKTIGAALQSRHIAPVPDAHAAIVARAVAHGAHLTGVTTS